ncbi:MAG: hypothetical protein OXE85_02820 [Roseovarius sp.]|nr:hypothetical protein [Roseovarius sp.]
MSVPVLAARVNMGGTVERMKIGTTTTIRALFKINRIRQLVVIKTIQKNELEPETSKSAKSTLAAGKMLKMGQRHNSSPWINPSKNLYQSAWMVPIPFRFLLLIKRLSCFASLSIFR